MEQHPKLKGVVGVPQLVGNAMSVEGANCERLYFEHLARLINLSGRNKYNLKIAPKAMSPKIYILYCAVAVDKIVFHIIAGLADAGLSVGLEVGQGIYR